MSTDVQAFAYHDTLGPDDGFRVRIIRDEDGELWWVLSDVCSAIGIANNRNVAARLSDDVKDVRSVDTLGGVQSVTVVNEPGLYEVIIRSDSPSASAFRHWVTSDVLPAIRKTGSYGRPALTGPELMAAALLEADRTLKAVTAELESAKPKAEAFDVFLGSNSDMSVSDAAKALARWGIHTGPNLLFRWLAHNRWTFKGTDDAPRAMQSKINLGHLAQKERGHHNPHTGEWVLDPPQIRVTTRGLELIARTMQAQAGKEVVK